MSPHPVFTRIVAILGGLALGAVAGVIASLALGGLADYNVETGGYRATPAVAVAAILEALVLVACLIGGTRLARAGRPAAGLFLVALAIAAALPVGSCDTILFHVHAA